MNKLFGTFTGCLLVICSATLISAQHPTIPFRQLESGARLSASISVPGPEAVITGSSVSYSSEPGLTAAISYMQPTYKRERVVDSKYILINGLHLGLAALDIGLTQHCIASHRCKEGNPLMPSSLAGQAAVNSALIGYGAFVSFRMKKNENRAWWLSPTLGIGAHTIGAVTGFLNR